MKAQERSHALLPPTFQRDWVWRFWPLVPLYPYGQRRTLRSEVVPGTIWTFDQIQGIFYVVVPIRMTVIKLEVGGLLVYAPIAPTPECLRLVRELETEHGEVKYIILPTVSGLEHKVFVGPFARQFPTAQVFVAPKQWSFPLNLPLTWLGFPRDRTQILPENSREAPFAGEFDYAVLEVDLSPRSFGEVALFHRPTQTLLVTDTVLSLPEEAPAVVQLDPYPLLFHAKDTEQDSPEDTPENRRKGWQRIALFAFYFQPSSLEVEKLVPSLREAFKAPDRSRRAFFGWYPFRWKSEWAAAFAALRGEGRLFVAPILQTLILNRAPQETLIWADTVAQWPFERLIPAHLEAPIATTPGEFRQAFAFLEQNSIAHHPLPEQDIAFLRTLDGDLSRRGITPPAKEKV